MKAMIVCIALGYGAPAYGEESTPNHRLALLSRLTCPAVREAVKVYGEAAAEQWARRSRCFGHQNRAGEALSQVAGNGCPILHALVQVLVFIDQSPQIRYRAIQ